MARLLVVSSRRVCTLFTLGRNCTGSPEGGISKTGKELTLVVSSLRVDTVAAAGLDISRKSVGSIYLSQKLAGYLYCTIFMLPVGAFGRHAWKV